MKINPKIAKTPEDLKVIEFKKMKVLIKKELKRLEKHTNPTEPTQFLILGEFDYPDKAAMALPVFGAWKGKFKDYAKKDVVKDKLGAIGTAYFGGIDESGQKKVHLNLAKGLGKNKSGKLERTLKKLIPQATYNVIFSEMDETLLDALEQKLDAAPEVEEVFEDESADDLVDDNQDIRQILIENLKEIISTLEKVKNVVNQVKQKQVSKEDALDDVINLDDLIFEWLEIYNKEANDSIKIEFNTNKADVLKIEEAVLKLIDSINNPIITSENFNKVISATTPPETPILLNVPHKTQSRGSTNCLNIAADMIETYLNGQKLGFLEVDYKQLRYKNPATGLMLVEQVDLRGRVYAPGKNSDKALAYINSCLEKNIPVLVGVSVVNFNGLDTKNPNLVGINLDGRYNEGTTDHFITIVGSFNNGGEIGYYYLDPGSVSAVQANQLVRSKVKELSFAWQDPSISWGQGYVLSRVLEYKLPIEAFDPNNTENPISGDLQSTVQKGVDSADVALVQYYLNKCGANLVIDRNCGTNTQNAIIDFQLRNNINPTDGIVSPESPTWLALKEKSGINPAPALSPEDIQLSYEGSIQKLSADKDLRLREMLANAGEPTATIINTFRSAAEQAAVMFANIKQLGPKVNSKLYRVPAAAAQVVAAYEKAVSEGISEDAKLTGVILEAIEKVGADQLSGHCDSGNPAVDIMPSSIKNRSKFEKIFNNKSLVAKFVAPPKDSSYHIEFK
jgi:peptidoglycan hydrolase-like protein with peptidoglycan-binding domain